MCTVRQPGHQSAAQCQPPARCLPKQSSATAEAATTSPPCKQAAGVRAAQFLQLGAYAAKK